MDALDRGMELIDIRPMREGIGSKADIWVPVRPGTDLALALAALTGILRGGPLRPRLHRELVQRL